MHESAESRVLDAPSPFIVSAWQELFARFNLLDDFSDVLDGFRFGFHTGVKSPVLNTFIPPNHRSAIQDPLAIDAHIQKELKLNRYSGPYSVSQATKLLGPFRTSPLGLVPKANSSSFRVIQDLSFPRSSATASVNSEIDSDDFPCAWGTFSQCALFVATAPAGTEAAVFDVDSAYRNIPIHPSEKAHFCVMWKDEIFIDHCVAFGSASSAGLFGRVADAFVAIIQKMGADKVIKWVDDFVFGRYPRPLTTLSVFLFDESLVFQTAAYTGLPWSLPKCSGFGPSFKYLGFLWCLRSRSVTLLDDKRLKFLSKLDALLLAKSADLNTAQKLSGSLNHCCFVVPLGRAHLIYLNRFISGFKPSAPTFQKHTVPAALRRELSWWSSLLKSPPLVRVLRTPSSVLSTQIFVDASSSWGIGVLIEGRWAAFQLLSSAIRNNSIIGVTEMLAVEFAVLLLVQLYPSGSHFQIHTDNLGVLHAINFGASKGLLQNASLVRLSSTLLKHDSFLTPKYIPSHDNPADPVSRGITPPSSLRIPISLSLDPSLSSTVRQL